MPHCYHAEFLEGGRLELRSTFPHILPGNKFGKKITQHPLQNLQFCFIFKLDPKVQMGQTPSTC